MKIKAVVLLLIGFAGLRVPTHAQNLTSLSPSDRASILSACEVDKQVSGPAAYHKCLNDQLRELADAGKAPSLAGLSYSDRASILSACEVDKQVSGAAAYHTCLNNQLSDLADAGKAPSLAALSYSDRASILSACEVDKQVSGAAAYHTCLNNQLRDLADAGASPVVRRQGTSPRRVRPATRPAASAAQASLPVIPASGSASAVPSPTISPALISGATVPATRTSTSTTTAGPCAENGSCYGDISPITGLPKTVAVHGYTRADGTYVRGYYRSKSK